jgi:hypothetical protein
MNRDDQHGGAHASKSKAEGRPDEQGNGRIEERGRSVRSRRQSIEGDVSDRENRRGKETCFQNAPGAALIPFVDSWWTPIRMAGTSTIAVTPFEMLRLRHSTQ